MNNKVTNYKGWRKNGGMSFAAKNNIVTSQYSNAALQSVTNAFGVADTEVLAATNLNLLTNNIRGAAKISFVDNSFQNTAYTVNQTGNLSVDNVVSMSDVVPLTLSGRSSGVYVDDRFTVSAETFIQDLTVANITASGNMSLTGSISISSDITGNGSCNISSSMTIGNNITIGEDISIGGNSNVASNQNIGKDLNIGNNVNIGNNTNIGNNLNISGHLNLGINAHIVNDAFIGGNLRINKDLLLSGILDVFGNVVFHSELIVERINTQTTHSSPLTIGGILNALQNVYCFSELNVERAVTFNGTLSVNSETTLSENLHVLGNTVLNTAVVENNLLCTTLGASGNNNPPINLISNLSRPLDDLTVSAGHSSNVPKTLSLNAYNVTIDAINNATISGQEIILNGNVFTNSLTTRTNNPNHNLEVFANLYLPLYDVTCKDLNVLSNTTIAETLHVLGNSTLETVLCSSIGATNSSINLLSNLSRPLDDLHITAGQSTQVPKTLSLNAYNCSILTNNDALISGNNILLHGSVYANGSVFANSFTTYNDVSGNINIMSNLVLPSSKSITCGSIFCNLQNTNKILLGTTTSNSTIPQILLQNANSGIALQGGLSNNQDYFNLKFLTGGTDIMTMNNTGNASNNILYVNSNITASGSLSVAGSLSIGGNFSTSGNLALTGSFTISSSTMNLFSVTPSSGVVIINSDLNMLNYNISCRNIYADNLYRGPSHGVFTNATIELDSNGFICNVLSGSAVSSGSSGYSSITQNSSGTINVSNNLTVSGNITVGSNKVILDNSGNITATGNIQCANLQLTGLTVSGSITVGSLHIPTNQYGENLLSVDGTIRINNGWFLVLYNGVSIFTVTDNDIWIYKQLNVGTSIATANSSFYGNVNINGTTTAAGRMIIKDASNNFVITQDQSGNITATGNITCNTLTANNLFKDTTRTSSHTYTNANVTVNSSGYITGLANGTTYSSITQNSNGNISISSNLSVTGAITSTADITSLRSITSYVGNGGGSSLSFYSSLPTDTGSTAGLGVCWNDQTGRGDVNLIGMGQGGYGGLVFSAAKSGNGITQLASFFPPIDGGITFNSIPQCSTATTGTNSTSMATTAFVYNSLINPNNTLYCSNLNGNNGTITLGSNLWSGNQNLTIQAGSYGDQHSTANRASIYLQSTNTNLNGSDHVYIEAPTITLTGTTNVSGTLSANTITNLFKDTTRASSYTYTNANITVNAAGYITGLANGSSSSSSGSYSSITQNSNGNISISSELSTNNIRTTGRIRIISESGGNTYALTANYYGIVIESGGLTIGNFTNDTIVRLDTDSNATNPMLNVYGDLSIHNGGAKLLVDGIQLSNINFFLNIKGCVKI